MQLFNTLSREKEEFIPLRKGSVGMYTCGPTVYNFPHLGNLRTYIFEDILKRTLIYNGYRVKHVMNITDVGHMTSDADEGEDKLEKGAQREGKTPSEVAAFYTKVFKKNLSDLNILHPDIYCAASGHISEQISLIKKLEEKGFAYNTSEAVYFEVPKFKDYAKFSGQKIEEKIVGAREEVEIGTRKKNPEDFVLWFKLVGKYKNHILRWSSPWGEGFPGWHIECSAMSMKYLGEQFDVHCGGIDHINIHHSNEIAQSEAAIGKNPWVKYWLHGEFLVLRGGEKMAKSEENFLTLENAFIKKHLNPLVYRYAVLQTHYRKQMEYSDEMILSAQNGLNNLYFQVGKEAMEAGIKNIFKRMMFKFKRPNQVFKEKFLLKINNDLNTPEALAILHELLKSSLSASEKLSTLLDFDKVLGLDFKKHIFYPETEQVLTSEHKKLIEQREGARKEKNWQKADEIRKQLEKEGIVLEDTQEGAKWRIERK